MSKLPNITDAEDALCFLFFFPAAAGSDIEKARGPAVSEVCPLRVGAGGGVVLRLYLV